MKRVRIKSDGTPKGTQVLVDGLPLGHVTHVKWELDAKSVAVAHLTVCCVEVDVEGEVAKP